MVTTALVIEPERNRPHTEVRVVRPPGSGTEAPVGGVYINRALR